MKNGLIKAFLFCITAPVFAVAGLDDKELAYSQNNPTLQHTATGYLAKDHPILLNADLLIGRAIGQPTNAFLQTISNGNDESLRTRDFENNVRGGFRVGLGIGLRNDFNLSVQWTRMSNGTIDYIEYRDANQTITSLQLLSTLTNAVTSSSVDAYSRQRIRYQTVDLLLQTAAWMLNSNLRFQPFGGVRYLYFRRSLFTKVENLNNLPQIADSNSRLRLRATGVLAGTDVKYIIARHFHFYSNILLAILAGHHDRDYFGNSNLGNNPNTEEIHEHFDLSMNPQLELRFGFAWEHVFNNQWILSFRVGYELSSLIQASAPAISPGPFVLSTSEPLRTNDVVKTQFFVFGMTLGF